MVRAKECASGAAIAESEILADSSLNEGLIRSHSHESNIQQKLSSESNVQSVSLARFFFRNQVFLEMKPAKFKIAFFQLSINK